MFNATVYYTCLRGVLKRIDMTGRSACYLVAASCILHNICELRKDDFLEEWLEDVHNAVEQPNNIPLANQRERDAPNIRDALAVFFMTPEGRTLGIIVSLFTIFT